MSAQAALFDTPPLADVTATPARITPIRDIRPADYLFSAMKIAPAQAIAAALRVCFPDAGTALDVTYGSDCFWDGTAHVEVTGLDANPARARDVCGDFEALPFAEGSFDVVIFDPPFLADGGKRSLMKARYTADLGSDASQASIMRGCQKAWRVSRLGVIVKVQDHIHGGKFVRMSDWVRAAVPMPQYDELLAPGGKIIDPKWKQPQLSLYRNHSTYLIFRKDSAVHKRRAPSPQLSRLLTGRRCLMCPVPIGDRRGDAVMCSATCRKRAQRRQQGRGR